MQTKSVDSVYFNHKASVNVGVRVFKTIKNAVCVDARFGTAIVLARKTPEIQLVLTAHQHRIPAWNENLLMSMSDALLRAVQRWITSQRYSMKTRCYITLQTVEPLALPLTRCLGVLTNIPIFAFFSVDNIFITNNFSHVTSAKF